MSFKNSANVFQIFYDPYPAAEPTTLPFLGLRRLPFDIEYFFLHFGGCVNINIEKSGNPHKHWIFALTDFPKNKRIWVLILTHAPLEDQDYTTDFRITRQDGTQYVRECVERSYLTKPKPLTIKLLDISRSYWLARNIKDWGIVTDAES